MFGSVGTSELLMILAVALVVFGPRRLPEIGRTIGESLAQFRRASEDFKRSWQQEVTLEQTRQSAAPAAAGPTPSVKEAVVSGPAGGPAGAVSPQPEVKEEPGHENHPPTDKP
jgi:Tat protein translocase TatB subunit